MKKSLISLAIVLVLSMVAALFVPTFAAKSDALVIDWSSADNNTIWPAAGDLPITWAGTPCGTSSFDATEGAWKMESNIKTWSWQGGYISINMPDVDWSEYKYMKFSYKTANIPDENDNPDTYGYVGFCGTGCVAISDPIPLSTGAYSEVVISTERFGATQDIILSWCNSGLTSVDAGATMWVKYIAFFKTEAEANSFDLKDWNGDLYGAQEESTPESSAPESSAPESSTPESSAPESSAPESSKPESSKPESSKPSADTGHGTVIGAAVMMFAAAAAVVAISKKR